MKQPVRLLAALLVLGAGAATASAKCPSANVLYRTTFSTRDDYWDTNPRLRLGGGRLVLHPTQKTSLGPLYNGKNFSDATICADFVVSETKGDDPVGGLIFWAPDGGHFFDFVISPVRKYASVGATQDGHFQSVIGWTHVSQIRSRLGSVNELAIRLHGADATATINGKPALTFQAPGDPPVPETWLAGVDAEAASASPATWTVTNFGVTK